ncbi:hypothetical protein LA345_28355, partial [Burkholderia vietnamiensis]|nr:hypothetical protein [Burkholderia vietnamiensis]
MQTSDERARLSRSGVSHGRIAASLVRSRRLFLRVNSNDAVKVGETAPFAMVRKRWMSPLTLALALFAIGSSEAIAQNASFKLLSAAQIRAKLTNKYVSDNAHWLHHYLPDGRLVLVERGEKKPGVGSSGTVNYAWYGPREYRNQNASIFMLRGVRSSIATRGKSLPLPVSEAVRTGAIDCDRGWQEYTSPVPAITAT